MEIKVIGDKVSLQIDGAFTAEELAQLLRQLGEARSRIANDPKDLSAGPVEIHGAAAPHFWSQPAGVVGLASLIAFLHPGLGWVGMLLSASDVAKLISLLSNQLAAAATAGSGGAANAADDSSKQLPTSGGRVLH